MQHDDDRVNRGFDVAARFVADQPGGVARLFSIHRPDDRGLCAGCLTPGTGVAYLPYPCPIAKIAEAAGKYQRWHQPELNDLDTSPEALDKARITRSLGHLRREDTRPYGD
jgi:hypothetical protein